MSPRPRVVVHKVAGSLSKGLLPVARQFLDLVERGDVVPYHGRPCDKDCGTSALQSRSGSIRQEKGRCYAPG